MNSGQPPPSPQKIQVKGLAENSDELTLYQLIFTTDEKLTIVYSIPDRIPTTLAFSHMNWCKVDVFTLDIMVLMFSL